MTILRRLTGRSLDALTTSLGLRPAYRLKYGTIEFIPCPMIKKVRAQPINQVGPSEMVQESVQKWTISLPIELALTFPTFQAWDEAIAPGALWSVTLPNSDVWQPAIVEGDRLDGNRGRVVITVRAIGLDGD